MPNKKRASPTWIDVRTALLRFDRAGLRGLVQDLYAASKDSQAFLYARLGLGADQLKPYRASISRWICPDLRRDQPISVSKAKKAIADYKKAIGRPEGLAELRARAKHIGWGVKDGLNSLWYDADLDSYQNE